MRNIFSGYLDVALKRAEYPENIQLAPTFKRSKGARSVHDVVWGLLTCVYSMATIIRNGRGCVYVDKNKLRFRKTGNRHLQYHSYRFGNRVRATDIYLTDYTDLTDRLLYRELYVLLCVWHKRQYEYLISNRFSLLFCSALYHRCDSERAAHVCLTSGT